MGAKKPDKILSPDERLEELEKGEYRDNLALEKQDELVEILVHSWNQIIKEIENKTILFALKVKKLLSGYPEKTITEVIEKVRNHPDLLHPAHSKDRIMQGLRLVRRRPDLIEFQKKSVEDIQSMQEEKRPRRKRDGSIHWEFYFQLYKYEMDPGIRRELEEKGKKEGWSYRKLRREIGKHLEEVRDPNTARRYKKRDMIREIVHMLKCLEPEDLKMIASVIKDEFTGKLQRYFQWLQKQEED